MEIKKHQQIAIEETINHLNAKGECVMALCTGSGKTYASYQIMNHYHQQNTEFRVLVLAHNQVILREQFLESSAQANTLTDKILAISNIKDINDARSANIVIAIPSTIYKNINDLGQFDLIVIDEAHEFADGKMHKRIISANLKAKRLYLTATHGKKELNNKPKVFYSVMEAYEDGIVANIEIAAIQTSWRYTRHDFNADNELSREYSFDNDSVDDACSKVMESMYEKIMIDQGMWKNRIQAIINKAKESKFLEKPAEIFNNWLDFTPRIMIACHSIAMADRVRDWFAKRLGENIALSSYSSGTEGKNPDPHSLNLLKFKNDKSVKVMVVAYRGVLGYDLPDLEYFIDMTGTCNVDRMMQMMGRTMRIHPENKKKRYLKVTPSRMIGITTDLLGVCVGLMHPENYRKYDGKYNEAKVALINRYDDEPWIDRAEKKAKVIEFINKNKRLPERFSSDANEARIRRLMAYYIRKSSVYFDENFFNSVVKTCKELKIKPPKKNPSRVRDDDDRDDAVVRLGEPILSLKEYALQFEYLKHRDDDFFSKVCLTSIADIKQMKSGTVSADEWKRLILEYAKTGIIYTPYTHEIRRQCEPIEDETAG